METGVPQGSLVGSILLLVFIDDLPIENPTFKCILYADDAKAGKVKPLFLQKRQFEYPNLGPK